VGELSSISPSGVIGERGCLNACIASIESIAVTTSGAIWFADRHPDCSSCGGGSGLINESEGTTLGMIRAGTLEIPSDVS
jgi:hypothetical protein